MEARERLDGLHLHDDQVIDDKIEPIAGVKAKPLVVKRLWNLSANDKAAKRKLVREASLVGGLEKTWT